MSRNAVLLALFAVSLAAGAWLFRREAPTEAESRGSCAGDASCGASPAGEQPASPAGGSTGDDPASSPPRDTAPRSGSAARSTPSAPSSATAAAGEALRAEADRLFAAGRPLEGIQKMREATEVDPSPKNHGDLGDLLQRLTAIDEALVHLRQAAELDPANADRWIALANAYYQAVNPGEAWNAEKRAKEAEPGLVLGRDKSGRRVRQGDSEPRKP